MENYNLKELEISTIKSCINNHPEYNHDEIAQLLGISTRTLYRKIKKLKIKPKKELDSIKYLQSIGYNIIKNK